MRNLDGLFQGVGLHRDVRGLWALQQVQALKDCIPLIVLI